MELNKQKLSRVKYCPPCYPNWETDYIILNIDFIENAPKKRLPLLAMLVSDQFLLSKQIFEIPTYFTTFEDPIMFPTSVY